MVNMSQQNTTTNVPVILPFSETILTPHSLFARVSSSLWVAFSYLLGGTFLWILDFHLSMGTTTITHVAHLKNEYPRRAI
jgi:hypothetical protein